MKKVLCPICGNVIRFDENERALTCPVCHSLLRIKIRSADDKNIDGAEFGMPTEQLYSDDEIIIAELDKTAPELFPSEGASLKAPEKRVPPVVGRKDKVSSPVQVRDNVVELGGLREVELKAGNNAETAGAATAKPEQSAKPVTQKPEQAAGVLAKAREPEKQTIPDSELKWVRWEDIECESELLEDDEPVTARAAAKQKKRIKVPADYRLMYLPVYAILTFISTLLLLYVPFLFVKGGTSVSLSGAKLIGGIMSGAEFVNHGTDIYLYLAGGLIMAFTVLSVCYVVYAFSRFGEYNKHTLNTSNVFAGAAGALVTALAVLFGLAANDCSDGLTALFGSLFLVVPLQAYVLISNLDKLPKYRDEKRVLLSPKNTRRKAYALLGVSTFFIWTLFIGAVCSLGGNVAYNALYAVNPLSAVLPKLSTLSIGIFGAVFNGIWIDGGAAASTQADYLIYSYIDIASFACTVLLFAAYVRYAGKTSSIFLEEIRPDGNENVLLENEIKEKNLARFLKKSSSACFILYAAVLTLNVAGYVVLYRGTEDALAAVFTMLSFVLAAAIRCYPYAILSREQYMKAYVEYEEMGADIPPMSKKQKKRLEIYPMLLALAIHILFIVLTFI